MENKIIEKWQEYVKVAPNYIIVTDENHPTGFSFSQVDNMANKVRSYLEKNQIGKENIVLINLPRGYEHMVAILGIMKAGSAFIETEDTTPKERVDFMCQDCGVKLKLTQEIFEKMMEESPIPGFKETDEHDLLCAYYTSGTTGQSKCILHEYGVLSWDQSFEKFAHEIVGDQGDSFIIFCPHNHVASLIAILKCLFCSIRIDIPNISTVKNFNLFEKYMEEHQTNGIYLTYSYAKQIKKFPSSIKRLILSGEAVFDFYQKEFKTIVFYTSTEGLFNILTYEIDGTEKEGCMPIGKPHFNSKISLLNEEGKEVSLGEKGELCFEKSPYFRGYLKNPIENQKKIKDGLYHTGDIIRQLPSGDYVFVGRETDMMKINGNRVEFSEVEVALKKVLNTNNIMVYGFHDTRDYLCAYYTDDMSLEKSVVNEKLGESLPYYMLPAYYIKLDEFPKNKNGKLSRKDLPKPELHSRKFVEPTDDISRKICEIFASVLNVKRFSADDDFFEMGGDSLSAIRVISELKWPDFSVTHLYKYKTPLQIANYYKGMKKNTNQNSTQLQPGDKFEVVHPTQLWYISFLQDFPDSLYPVEALLRKIKSNIKLDKFVNALNKTIRFFPVLSCIFEKGDNDKIYQKYCPELLPDIVPIELSEDEFQKKKSGLLKPFAPFGQLMNRINVFKTEKHTYFFISLVHCIFDGYSLNMFFEVLKKFYKNEELDFVDSFYQLKMNEKKNIPSVESLEAEHQKLIKRFGNKDWLILPNNENESFSETFDSAVRRKYKIEQIDEFCQNKKISRNIFFIAVNLITMSLFTHYSKILIRWTFEDRKTDEEYHSFNCFIKDKIVAFDFDQSISWNDYVENIKNQVFEGFIQTPYTKEYFYPKIPLTMGFERFDFDKCDYFLCQVEEENLNSGYPDGIEGADFMIFDQSNEIEIQEVFLTQKSLKKYISLFEQVANTLTKQTEIMNLKDLFKFNFDSKSQTHIFNFGKADNKNDIL